MTAIGRSAASVSDGSTTQRGVLSIVVGCYNMKREIRRTIQSLSGGYQRQISPADYEVILVDNGSKEPPRSEDFSDLEVNLKVLHYPNPTPSPMRALNFGLATCANDLIGVLIDGARMATPGLCAAVVNAAKLHPRAIIFTQSLQLGPGFQSETMQDGYDKAFEDRLLDHINWPENGYRLFEIGSWYMHGESEDRWAQLRFESNALFMPRALWDEIGGYDPSFASIGGGAGSGDVFHRACDLPDVQLIVVTGEATFHQIHDDSASSSSSEWLTRFKEYNREHHRLRDKPYRLVRNDYWTFGMAPPEAYLKQPDIVRAKLPKPSGDSSPSGDIVAERYLELLKQALLNETNLDFEAHWMSLLRTLEVRGIKIPEVSDHFRRQNLRRLIASRKVGMHTAQLPFALTLIGRVRLENIEACVRTVLKENIVGDFVECGVWRGGACIFMAGMLAAHGIDNRIVWAANSFEGFPVTEDQRDELLNEGLRGVRGLVIPQEQVQQNFERFGLWSNNVRLLRGWFKDLPDAPIERIAVLRLDGDLYSSTMQTLEALYDKVTPGGFVIVDDFNSIENCANAVRDFREARGIDDPILKVDWSGAYWRKANA